MAKQLIWATYFPNTWSKPWMAGRFTFRKICPVNTATRIFYRGSW